MRTSTIAFAALGVAATAAPALADDAAAPPAAVTITGGATLVSDYRFRGISQTDKRFAVQGTFNVNTAAGPYVGVWGSSIDDYIANGGDQEIDLYAGYKKTIGPAAIDGGVLYYYYPGSGGVNSDFFEPYLNASFTFGPVGAKIGANYAWKQHALSIGTKPREDNFYLYGELSAAIPSTGVTLTGHLGHSYGPSYLTIGKGYTDYSIAAAYTWKQLTFGVSYVDTNKDLTIVNGSGHNRDISKGGIVGSVGVAF